MNNDSVKKILLVALSLCIVCSILVSGAAVFLKDKQDFNIKMDIKKNLLMASGLLPNDDPTIAEIDAAFSKITPQVIVLATGEEASDIDVNNFDQKKAAKDKTLNWLIPADQDIARIKMRSQYAKVYLIKEAGTTQMIVLPIHGKGLWSTLYGFMALSPDTKTIKGFGFYQHGETPGLGGEVDNPRWKAQWTGKMPFDAEFNPIIEVIKGFAKKDSLTQIDGLSGATLTSRGVSNLVQFWLGENGFGPYLERLRSGL